MSKHLLLTLAVALAGFAEASAAPNILFIFSDDHAFQAVGAYGSVINKTPHIDRIAAEGVRFDRCYVTNSICGPSRACIQTGKYSHLNGFYKNGNRFDGSQQTFPKLLQAVGYQTAIVGKWHLGTDPTGFDFWKVLPGQGRYYSPVFLTPEGRVTQPGYTTDVITDEALDWLKNQRRDDQPFMLMVQHKAPHREWAPGPAHVADFADEEIAEPATLFDDYSNRTEAAHNATMRISQDMRMVQDLKVFEPDSQHGKRMLALMDDDQRARWLAAYSAENEAFLAANLEGDELVRWKYQRYIKDYVRCIQSVDDGVGRLLDYLDESGLADDTVVIYSSDQGFYLGEHGWFDKRFMYEESFRTPLVARWPGVTAAGGVEERIVSNLDFAETFLEMAGADVPGDMQGRSLVPLLRGETPADWRTSFYYHYYEGPPAVHTVAEHYGVADGRYKLIHFYKLDQWELFDLETDPHEIKSVYGNPNYADVQARLLKELHRLRAELKVESNESQ